MLSEYAGRVEVYFKQLHSVGIPIPKLLIPACSLSACPASDGVPDGQAGSTRILVRYWTSLFYNNETSTTFWFSNPPLVRSIFSVEHPPEVEYIL
jgi:hypothetical protein